MTEQESENSNTPIKNEDITKQIDDNNDSPVTVSVIRRVKPGKEAELEECISGMTKSAMSYPGHLGTTVFRPASPEDHEYRIIFKFDRMSHLRRWEESGEWGKWNTRAQEFQQEEPKAQAVTGMETWFALPHQKAEAPPRYKMALTTWLGAFPMLTISYLLFGPFLNQVPLMLRAMLLTAILIAFLTWVAMPLLTRLFARWLYPTQKAKQKG